jgi:hypothetical protein
MMNTVKRRIMSFWKELSNDIQIEILMNFDDITILYFYENNIRLPDYFIDLYKKKKINKRDYNNYIYNFMGVDRIIYWIQTDNTNIIEFLYIKMEYDKFLECLLFFSLLYGTEYFINYLMEKFSIEKLINLNYHIIDHSYFYGYELIAFKLRNGFFTKGSKYLSDMCDNFAYKNTFIRNKLINYRSNEKISMRYFYIIEKVYKEMVKKESKKLNNIEDYLNIINNNLG